MAVREKNQRVDRAPSVKQSSGRAYLYEAEGTDREVELTEAILDELRDDELLWMDLEDLENAPDAIISKLGVDQADIERALRPSGRPTLTAREKYFHVNTVIVVRGENGFEPAELHCFVAKNWILTTHTGSLDLLGDFNRPIRGESDIGHLDGPVFLATLIDWALTGYYRVLEMLEDRVDMLDEKLLTQDMQQEELLDQLVRLRRRITELRRLLAPHRDVLVVLTQPHASMFTAAETTSHFQRVFDRLEKAIESVDTARDMLIGSFEVFMTQTAQRTNDVMKTLALISALLLPSIVLAGILGMNFQVGLFDHPGLFWVTLGVMGVLVCISLWFARRRDWI